MNKILIIAAATLTACSVYEGGEGETFDSSADGSDGAESGGDDGPFNVPGAVAELEDPETDPSVVVGPGDPDAPPLEVRPGDIVTLTLPFTAANSNVVGAGVRFGNSGPITVVPIAGAMGQGSGSMQFDLEIPDSVCDDLAQICHDIKCYEFAVTDAGNVSAANIGQIALACGNCDEPSCQDLLPSCQLDCDAQFVAGGDVPETHEVELGASWGTIDFSYNTASQEDRLLVTYQGLLMFDTGCVGSSGTVPLMYSGTDTKITVEVMPNCAANGSTGTVWDFSVSCPS